MNKIKGKISLEAVVYLGFAIVIAFAAASYARFFSGQNGANGTGTDIISAYDTLMNALKDDARLAAECKTQKLEISFFNKDHALISVYKLNNGELSRLSPKNTEQIIVKGVAEAEFSLDAELPSLVKIIVIPEDKTLLPFFTSFALRAYEAPQK